MHYDTGCDIHFSFIIQVPLIFDPVNFKFHNRWKISNKNNMATARKKEGV